MKLLILGWIALSSVCSYSVARMAAGMQAIEGVVVKNVDGDTVYVCPVDDFSCRQDPSSSEAKLKIRMIGMDAPETHVPTTSGMVGQGPWGEKAASWLAKTIPVGRNVKVLEFGQDKYKRVLGRIVVDGLDINLDMVRQGFAIPYIICSAEECESAFFEEQNVREYVQACELAQQEGRGIFDFQYPLKEMPFEFRLRVQHRKADKWVGNLDTKTFYEPSDYRRVDVCKRIFFMSAKDALRAGFSHALPNRLPLLAVF
ncbi:MAG: thermonuclease family protein [Deltaproteobacteria bacterium]|nr:thermonuclease family protein [Deltaproteobacteria bacterium]